MNMTPTNFYLLLSVALFCIGAFGVVIRRNVLVVFMCLEIMLNAANLSLVAFSQSYGNLDGQIFVLFVMVIAAAEATVGLAIVVSLFRNFYQVTTDDVKILNG